MSKTVVIGASPNTNRYSNMAVIKLKKYGHEVEAVGLRNGDIDGVSIEKGQPEIEGAHTVTMYVGARNQPPLYDYILSLNPERVIFNPGAENPELEQKLKDRNVEVLQACTLVMLSTGDF